MCATAPLTASTLAFDPNQQMQGIRGEAHVLMRILVHQATVRLNPLAALLRDVYHARAGSSSER